MAPEKGDLMPVVLAFQALLTPPAVRMHHTAGLNRFLHKGHQAVGRSVRNALHPNTSNPSSVLFGCHHNQGLALGLPTPNPSSGAPQ